MAGNLHSVGTKSKRARRRIWRLLASLLVVAAVPACAGATVTANNTLARGWTHTLDSIGQAARECQRWVADPRYSPERVVSYQEATALITELVASYLGPEWVVGPDAGASRKTATYNWDRAPAPLRDWSFSPRARRADGSRATPPNFWIRAKMDPRDHCRAPTLTVEGEAMLHDGPLVAMINGADDELLSSLVERASTESALRKRPRAVDSAPYKFACPDRAVWSALTQGASDREVRIDGEFTPGYPELVKPPSFSEPPRPDERQWEQWAQAHPRRRLVRVEAVAMATQRAVEQSFAASEVDAASTPAGATTEVGHEVLARDLNNGECVRLWVRGGATTHAATARLDVPLVLRVGEAYLLLGQSDRPDSYDLMLRTLQSYELMFSYSSPTTTRGIERLSATSLVGPLIAGA